MKGLIICIYRCKSFACTNGVSATADEALVIGDGIPEVFEANGRPVLRLERNRDGKTARLIPVDVVGWLAFGGNYGATSDSRFSEAVRAIYGSEFYGAVPIHDHVC